MTDLLDRLARLDATSGTTASTADDVVANDLARGHTALGRRRRTRAGLAGAGLTLGVGAAFGVVAVVGNDDSPPAAGPSGTSSADVALPLVAYSGPQVEGFELAKVPSGYEIQGSDQFVLTLAKPGDTSHYLAFEGKVVVMLESQDAPQRLGDGTEVTVNGNPGVLQANGEGTRNLRWFDGERLVLIQVWEGIDLTDAQVVELAESITVTADVVAGVG